MRFLVLSCFFLFAARAEAQAHPLIETGIAQVSDAAFEEALSSFDSAWNGSGLTREDVIALLANRAVANFALRASAAVDRDLGFLAVIDRSYAFAPHVPPPMRDRFEQIRKQTGQPSLSVLTRFGLGRASIELEVHEMPRELIRETRVFARPVGGAFVASATGSLELANPEEHAIEWYAEVVGPGGAVLLKEGEAGAPRRALHAPALTASSTSAPPARPTPAQQPESNGRTWRWWAIGGSTAAAAVATTVAVLLVREPTPNTQVSSPVLK